MPPQTFVIFLNGPESKLVRLAQNAHSAKIFFTRVIVSGD